MIYSRSPYYVDINATSISNAQRYEMRLYIWKGNIAVIPTTPTYVFNNNLHDKQGVVNISNYINDFFTNQTSVFSNTNEIIYNNDVVYCRWEVDIITSTSTVTDFIVGGRYALNGYTLFIEGRNFTPNIDSDFYTTFAGNNFRVYDKFLIGVNAMNDDVVVTAYPSATILLSETIVSTNNTDKQSFYIALNNLSALNDKYIEVDIYGDKVYIELIKECKYEPIDVQFKNRYGVSQIVTFFKKTTKSINVTRSNFERKSYNRQLINYNTNGNEDIVLTSGYNKEEFNDIIEQLLLSENVWIRDRATFIPYNIKSNKLSYKTKLNDKLISYEITFEQAFNLINNV